MRKLLFASYLSLVVACIVKAIQVVNCFNEAIGGLDKTVEVYDTTQVISLIFFAVSLVIMGIFLRKTIKDNSAPQKYQLSIGLYVFAVVLFSQAVLGTVENYQACVDLFNSMASSGYERTLILQVCSPYIFAIVTDLACLPAGIMAIKIQLNTEANKKNSTALAIPIFIWATMVLLRFTVSFTELVSMQSSQQMYISLALMIAFLFIVLDFDRMMVKFKNNTSLIIIALFSLFGAYFNLPYLLAQPFGVRDMVQIIPLYAVVSVVVMSVITTIGMTANANTKA